MVLSKDMRGPLILDSFEKGGKIFPPTYQECSNCIRILTKLSLSFLGEEIEYVCDARRNYVPPDGWCPGHILDTMLIDDEVLEAIEEAERLGTLPNDYDITEEELEELRAEN